MNALTVFVQGQSAVSADELNTFAQVTALATDLESFIGKTGMMVYVAGTHAISDGGQGWYYWSPTAVGPTVLPQVVVPTGAGSGAWVEIPGSGYTPPSVDANSIMGNNTAGPIAPVALSGGEATALLVAFLGDGSGLAKGLVPAPASGDAALHKGLLASGAWGRVGYIGAPVANPPPTLPYSLLVTDAGMTLFFSANGAVTIPAGLEVGDVFDIGWAAGFVGTVVPGGGVTLTNPVGGVTGTFTVTGLGFITIQIVAANTAVIRGAQNVV